MRRTTFTALAVLALTLAAPAAAFAGPTRTAPSAPSAPGEVYNAMVNLPASNRAVGYVTWSAATDGVGSRGKVTGYTATFLDGSGRRVARCTARGQRHPAISRECWVYGSNRKLGTIETVSVVAHSKAGSSVAATLPVVTYDSAIAPDAPTDVTATYRTNASGAFILVEFAYDDDNRRGLISSFGYTVLDSSDTPIAGYENKTCAQSVWTPVCTIPVAAGDVASVDSVTLTLRGPRFDSTPVTVEVTGLPTS